MADLTEMALAKRRGGGYLRELLAGISAKHQASSQECPACDVCGWKFEYCFRGSRYIQLGEPDNDAAQRIVDRYKFCECPDGEALMQAAIAEQQAETERFYASHRTLFWDASQVPPKFRDFELGPPLPTDVQKLLRRQTPEPESWLLWGEYGRGKTGAAVGYARQWVYGEGFPMRALFIAVTDLLQEFKASFNAGRGELDESDIVAKYKNIPLLVLDDIGKEQASGYSRDRLYQVINHRHSRRLPTVVTSNLDPRTELGDQIGEATVWRLVEMCDGRIKEVKGPNLRAQKGR